jgi:hypothetical protein
VFILKEIMSSRMNTSRWSRVIVFPALFEMEIESGANARRLTVSKFSFLFYHGGQCSAARVKEQGEARRPQMDADRNTENGGEDFIGNVQGRGREGGTEDSKLIGVTDRRSEI